MSEENTATRTKSKASTKSKKKVFNTGDIRKILEKKGISKYIIEKINDNYITKEDKESGILNRCSISVTHCLYAGLFIMLLFPIVVH